MDSLVSQGTEDLSAAFNRLAVESLRMHAKEIFGIDIRMRPQLKPPPYCPEAVAAQCVIGWETLSIGRLCELQLWAVRFGWQISAQQYQPIASDTCPVNVVYLAPIQPLTHSILYHATRTASIASILTYGLERGTKERQNTDRGDSVGNIYTVAKLGSPLDAGKRGSNSAHWWRDHLAQVNQFGDPDWSIVKIDVDAIREAVLFSDMWSESGIIIGNVESVQPKHLSIAYPLPG